MWTATTGCGGDAGKPAPPHWNPVAIAAKAFDQLDLDRNDSLNADELAKAPGLAGALSKIDSDKNQQISRAELQQRIVVYKETGAVESVALLVTAKKQPVARALVRLTPEKFLEGVVGPAEGRTNAFGLARPRMASASVDGVHFGFYRVEVDSPQLARLKEANRKNALGIEVAPAAESENDENSIGAIEIALGS